MSDQKVLADVLAQYGLQARRVSLVTDNPKKPVWHVMTPRGEFYLKESHLSPARLRFTLAAINHLGKRGVRTPPVVETAAGRGYAEVDNRLFTVSAAVPGIAPDYNSHLEIITRSLGRFHRAGTGFKMPTDAEEHSHLGLWPQHYAKKLTELQDFANLARQREAPFARLFLQELPFMQEQAEQAAQRLQDGRYAAWVEKAHRQGCLCHQDYAASNLRLVGRDLYVLDMDGVTTDVPARDLRKLYNKVMKKGKWDANLATRMLSWYRSGNGLSRDETWVLLADLQFPHLFCGLANKYFTNRVEEGWGEIKMHAKLDAVCRVERQKKKVLPALIPR